MADQLILTATPARGAAAGTGHYAAVLATTTPDGHGSTNFVTTTTVGGLDIPVTDTAGGNPSSWWFQFGAATGFGSNLTALIRGLESSLAVNAGAGILVEHYAADASTYIADILSDRTVPTVITEWTASATNKSLASVAAASQNYTAGDWGKITLKQRNVGSMAAGTATVITGVSGSFSSLTFATTLPVYQQALPVVEAFSGGTNDAWNPSIWRQVVAYAAAPATIQSGMGQAVLGDGFQGTAMYTGGAVSTVDTDITGYFYFIDATLNQYATVCWRSDGVGDTLGNGSTRNGYDMSIQRNSSNAYVYQCHRINNSVFTDLLGGDQACPLAGGVWPSNTPINFRIIHTGTTIRGYIWTGSTPPPTPTFAVVDGTPYSTAGGAMLTYLSGQAGTGTCTGAFGPFTFGPPFSPAVAVTRRRRRVFLPRRRSTITQIPASGPAVDPIAGTFAATAGMSSTLVDIETIAATFAAAAAMAGTLVDTESVSSTQAAQATQSGTLLDNEFIAATQSAQASMAASPFGTEIVAAAFAAVAAQSATLFGVETIGGTFAALATMTGSPAVVQALTGTFAAVAAQSGALADTEPVSSTQSAQASMSGSLLDTEPVTGTFAATAALSATLSDQEFIAATLAAQAAMSATLTGTTFPAGTFAALAQMAATVFGVETVTAGQAAQASMSAVLVDTEIVTAAQAAQAAMNATVVISGIDPVTGTFAALAAMSGSLSDTEIVAAEQDAVAAMTATLLDTETVASTQAAQAAMSAALTSFAVDPTGGTFSAQATMTGGLTGVEIVASTQAARASMAGAIIGVEVVGATFAAIATLTGSLVDVQPTGGTFAAIAELLGVLEDPTRFRDITVGVATGRDPWSVVTGMDRISVVTGKDRWQVVTGATRWGVLTGRDPWQVTTQEAD